MNCTNCGFFQQEEVEYCDEVQVVWLCRATEADTCPMNDELLLQAMEEAVVPCTRCGQDVDGHGVIDGIPVCPVCDKGVL